MCFFTAYVYTQPSNMNSKDEEVIMYHRFLEACKFAFSKRAELGDPDYVDIQNVSSQSVSQSASQPVGRSVSQLDNQSVY